MADRPASPLDRFLDWLGHRLATKLTADASGYAPFTPPDYDTLCRVLQPGDVILVEGRERGSTAIKYPTQPT